MDQRKAECRYDSYCGLYCGACGILMATETGQTDEECWGCKSDKVAKHCNDCRIKACAQSRNVAFCCDCSDYPCKTLTAFKEDGWPHHLVGVSNLNAIRRQGIQQWLADQETRWKCPGCGRKFEYYQTNCPQCGRHLRDSRVEAQELMNRDHLQITLKDI